MKAPAPTRRWWHTLLSAKIDITPLRTSSQFRVLFVAGTIFYLGAMFGFVAVPYQLYTLTGSNLAVGAMGVVQLVPLIIFGLYGGALADHVDRRKMMVWSGVAQTVLASLLLVNALLDHPHVWLLYVIGGAMSAASALQRPSREALIPRVVKHSELPAAVALSSLGYQIGMLIGPGVGGILIAKFGVFVAFGVEAGGFALASLVLLLLRPAPPLGDTVAPSWSGIKAGITYATGRKDLLGTYVIDMVGMFMAMPIVLFPALAADILREPTMLGLLYTAEAIGSMIATVTSGWTSRVYRHGRAVTCAAIGWGAFIGLAGLMPNAWLVIACLAVAGGFDMISAIFRGVIWHQTIPDEMRGRLAGIEMLSYSIGPLGGQLRSGVVADLTTVRASIVSGGILCVVGVSATASVLKEFWSYDARTDEHAVRQRALSATI
ncbi:MFS transporter [Nakamurella antarctica]|uniref:MFS transporter n=1 Tax=Nakamurella antarctica TaxID=1902245 RepID=A0A3G8ZVL3_9ACTN|nr:MFS transporter [Nakamurella antarctica]AZI58056.1 MFS transporter [Nakamurella antarctica]